VTFLLLRAALIGLLYLGLPMFAALFLLPLAVLLWVEGGVPALGELVVGQLDGYLLVAIPQMLRSGRARHHAFGGGAGGGTLGILIPPRRRWFSTPM
jgi:TRAP-type mannitol/chloroaromatic compound transport system permease large subunit